jgi:hypothetical protein
MCDWTVAHFTNVPPPFHSLALALYRFFSSVPSTLPALPSPPEATTPRLHLTPVDAEDEGDANPRAAKRGRTSKAAKESAASLLPPPAEENADARQRRAEARRRELEEDRQRERALVLEYAFEEERIDLLTRLTSETPAGK